MEIETIQVAEKSLQEGEKLYFENTCNLEVITDDSSIIGKFLIIPSEDYKPFSTKEFDFRVLYCENFKDKLLLPHKLEIVLNRLNFPYELRKETQRKFASYLRKIWLPELLKNNNVESIIKYAIYLVIGENVDEILEKASTIGLTDLVAFLLDYKQNILKIDPSTKKIPELKPVTPIITVQDIYQDIREEWEFQEMYALKLELLGYKGNSKDTITFPSFAGRRFFAYVGTHFNFWHYCGEIIIPEGYEHLSYKAFSYRSVMKMTLPDSLTYIGEKAFLHCSNLQNIHLGSQLTTIENETFSYCQELREIDIPDNITSIKYKAFYFCENLLEVVLGKGLEYIADRAFAHCLKLKSIILPSSIKDISPNAFDNSGITLIELDQDNEYFTVNNGALYKKNSLDLIISSPFIIRRLFLPVTDLTKVSPQLQELLEGGDSFDFNDNNCWDYREIFQNNKNLKRISWPESQKHLPDRMFCGCNSLIDVTLPLDLESIGIKAFENCISLSEIKIPKGLDSIGYNTFKNCISLKNMVLPIGLHSIGESAFAGCESLISIELPFGLIEIHNEAFKDCKSLEEINIPESVVYIGKRAFDNCSNLKKITLPLRFEYLNGGELGGSTPDKITIARNQDFILSGRLVLSGDGHELINYKGDTYGFTIPENIIKIGDHAFINRDLRKLVIPNYVEEISRLAFINLDCLTVQVAMKFFRQGTQVFLGNTQCVEVIGEDGRIIGIFSGYGIVSKLLDPLSNSLAPQDYDRIINGIPTRHLNVEVKIQNALDRLNLPYELSEDAKTKYFSFLRRWWLPRLINNIQRIEGNDIILIYKYSDHLITKKNVDVILAKANSASITDLVAFILDYKQKKLKNNINRLPLLTIKTVAQKKPRNPNSIREIEKNWKIVKGNETELKLAGYKGDKVDVLIFPSYKGKKPIKHVGFNFSLSHSVDEIIIPEGYISLGISAFSHHDQKKIKLPDSLLDIGSHAFNNCYKLEEIELGSNLSKIESATFAFCVELKHIEIPENVKIIGNHAFWGCKNLEDVKLGNKLEMIGAGAFANCPNLKSIKLPSSLKDIAPNAFENSGIVKIDIDSDNKFLTIKDGVLYHGEMKIIIPSLLDESSY